MSENGKNVYQRVNAVMKEVAYVQKDAKVTPGGGSYMAVTHDMLTAVIRPYLVKHGIVVRPQQLHGELLQQRGTNPKSDQEYTMHLYSGNYDVHFVNIDKPDDFVTIPVNAHANDSGDKAPGKAMSYAVKYAMLKLFSLETGENEEARFAEPYTSEQFEVYHDLIEQKSAYEFFLFVSTLPTETQTGLYNSFPDGKKSAGKKAVTKLTQEGHEIFDNTVQEIKQRIGSQDTSVTELTDEMNAVEKRFLASRLTDFEVKTLAKLKELQA